MLKVENDLITGKKQLKQLFLGGCKNSQNFKTGIEFEKLSVSSVGFKAVPYAGTKGIRSVLAALNKDNKWSQIAENQNLIGLSKNDSIITLEPGSQLELSIMPQKSINSLKEKIDKFNEKTSQIGSNFGIKWLGYGITPVSTNRDINLIPKGRYACMAEYMPKKGILSPVMMRETAGIQVAFDYESEADAIQKLRLSVALSPIVSAIFANSPIRNSKDTGYKSFRANSWLQTDENRCGLISEKLFNPSCEFTFDDYIDVLLDIPMIFIVRNDKIIKTNGIPFKEFLKNGYQGFNATINDWELHASLFFPDVRLKNYIEIRNQDCQRSDLIFAIPALWKGLLYNKTAYGDAFELIKGFSWYELNEMRSSTPKNGLDKGLWAIAKELIKISKISLKNAKNDEEKYIKPLEELVQQEITPADIILKNWYGRWDKDISKLIDYVKI